MNQIDMLNFAIETAKEAGCILMKHFGNISNIKKKSTNIDLLTIADTQSEASIIDRIKHSFPNHNILAEESNLKNNYSEYTWVIDPLDGTTNFVHNIPIFAVSIGLRRNNETILGAVYNPAVDKCFWAEKNKGAKLNSETIQVSSTNTLCDSLLVTGFPYLHDNRYDKGFALFKDLYDRTQGVRRLGAAALDLCFVAMGRFEGYWEFGLQPWDVCAGELIVREAGGKTSDWDNSSIPFDGTRVLSTNGHIHDEVVKILSNDLF